MNVNVHLSLAQYRGVPGGNGTQNTVQRIFFLSIQSIHSLNASTSFAVVMYAHTPSA